MDQHATPAQRDRAALADPPVLLDASDSIATLTLNRPGALNALSAEAIRAFREALRQAVASRARALVLTGQGRAFCVGADLFDPELTGAEAAGRNVMDESITPLMRDLLELPIPTIAAVNGVAAGGGIGLALAADIVLAAQGAQFINVFVPKLGLIPDMGVTWHLARSLGPARARALAFLGQPIPAAEAQELGLIWRACPDAQLMADAMTMARRLAAGPPLAMARTRLALDAALHNSLIDQLSVERDHQTALNATEDAREGIAAFREKRPPVFRGR